MDGDSMQSKDHGTDEDAAAHERATTESKNTDAVIEEVEYKYGPLEVDTDAQNDAENPDDLFFPTEVEINKPQTKSQDIIKASQMEQ